MELSDKETAFLNAIEVHDYKEIRGLFKSGLSPIATIQHKTLLEQLVCMYTRSSSFTKCVQEILEVAPDQSTPILSAVLLDDDEAVRRLLEKQPSLLLGTYNFSTAYIPFNKASLLHLCAEFNLVKVLKLLLGMGMDVDTKAGIDLNGFGGQSPIFHTVNQNQNASEKAMKILLSFGASLEISIRGVIWGEGYQWESFIPAVNPISFAMMGNLPQMHRNPIDIAENIRVLIKEAWDIDYKPRNIPNQYLQS